MKEFIFKDECYRIQGAIFEVYRQMGCGFLELVDFGHYPKATVKRIIL